MSTETYLTSRQTRDRFRLSEAGLRNAVAKGIFPAPIQIGAKRLFALSRLDTYERELLDDAAHREAAAKANEVLR